MNVIYTTNSAGCRAVKEWMKRNAIDFVERKVERGTVLEKGEVRDILIKAENGFDGLLCAHSKAYKAIEDRIDSMGTNALVEYICKHPAILRKPLVNSAKWIVVGNREEELDLLRRTRRAAA